MREDRMLRTGPSKPLRNQPSQATSATVKVQGWQTEVMSRYTSVEKVKLALRAPAGGDTSWTDGTYDELLVESCLEADQHVDDLCPGWAPFDRTAVSEDRSYRADGAAVYGILTTRPFAVAPTSVTVDGQAVTLAYEPHFEIEVVRPGKSLEITNPKHCWTEGVLYTLHGATWEWRAIPPETKLAATRIAARSFMAERTAMGILEFEAGMMYEPKYDSQVCRWLGPYMGGEVV